MLVMLGIGSIVMTLILVALGLSLRFSGKKTEKPEEQRPNTNGSNDPKMQDEPKDFWYWLGYAEDAPNVIRGIVAGPSGKGTVKRYITYQHDITLDTYGKPFINADGEWALTPLAIGKYGTGRYREESDFDYWLREKYGKRRFGFPIINSLKELTIDRVVKVDTQVVQETQKAPGTEADPRILRTIVGNRVKRRGLYEDITRFTSHLWVDTIEGVRFTVISTLIIKTVNPIPAFEKYPDSLLENVSEVVQNFFSDIVTKWDWPKYKAAMGQKGGHKFTDAELLKLREVLVPFGVKIIQYTVSDPELHPDIQKEFDKRAGATVAAETTVIGAEATAKAREKQARSDASYIKQTGTAEAEVIERKAKANRIRFEQLVEYYISKGATEENAISMANTVILTEVSAEAVGNLKGTYAPGKKGGILFNNSGGEK